MSKVNSEKIWITTYEDDGQTDVEVYEWKESENQKGNLYEHLSEYGFTSQSESKNHIEKLKKQYQLIGVSTLEEEEESFEKELPLKQFAPLKPTSLVYEISATELGERIETYLSKKIGHPVRIELENGEGESWSRLKILYYVTEHPDWVTNLLQSTYQMELGETEYDLSTEIVEDTLGIPIEKYHWDPFYNNTIFMYAPLQ